MTELELKQLLSKITRPDETARTAAHAHWASLAKPLGGLGRLETMLEDAAALTGTAELAFSRRAVLVLCADVILKDYHPLNLFVYADAESKIQRCIDRAPEGEHLSRNDIARRMKQVDKNRAQYRQMFADNKWGAKETYHLCVNTSGHEIKDLIPGLAAFVRCWFGEK